MENGHRAWNTYVQARRAGKSDKRPVADILIGGFAMNRSGLVTRNTADFKRWFPKLTIREP
jgi:predicted nucleic acid-binding protein